jgi:hypothetical protein
MRVVMKVSAISGRHLAQFRSTLSWSILFLAGAAFTLLLVYVITGAFGRN